MYQRMVNRMFKGLLGRNMEVYVDDMLVKSKACESHANNLAKCFEVVRRYGMKLNLKKCTFGVKSEKFLGFIVSERGIEANPEKIQTLLNMPSPKKHKDVQSLIGKVLGQVLADCITECNEAEASANIPVPQTPTWKVFVDEASSENESRAGIAMISTNGLRLQAVLRFEFPASNNEAEYEALIAGLKSAKVLGAMRVEVFSDFQLVVNQVSGEYQMCGEKMAAYVAIFWELLHEFTDYKVERIPREKNVHADCLAKLASDSEVEKLGVVPVERLTEPSIKTKNIVAAV
ncbi:uncharacterized protein LOC133034562 [Cannabis sativa]|uniref:uncharacterized protein LOC133034562 n=1 Tax=Cannabis sativa TaxID=3483 RepID=UPI0029C9BFBE|nr:uncharacterized protein LOC133034562 [Cannabis sativa]